MRVVHICLSCFYIDDHSYQENILVRKHIEQGHDVKVLASTEVFDRNKKISYVEPSVYVGSDGAEVHRIAYASWLPHSIMKKLRVHNSVNLFLENFKPDVIVFHGMCGWELLTVVNYVEKNTKTKLHVDSHEDFVNSARSPISKYILHGIYYKMIARLAIKKLEKVLCVSVSVMEFLRDFYGLPESKLEFYPLGGEIPDDNEYHHLRTQYRTKFSICESDILFVQTGKQTNRKKLLSSVRAFHSSDQKQFKFIIAGIIDSDDQEEIKELINADARIEFIGWCSSEEIDGLLCAADVYLQPGTQSATMQNSLCKRCVVVLDKVNSHIPYVKQNGWLIDSNLTLTNIVEQIALKKNELTTMSNSSYMLAKEILDYNILAKKLLD